MNKLGLIPAIVFSVVITHGSANAGFLTATLNANPSTISGEAGYSRLSLTLSHVDRTSGSFESTAYNNFSGYGTDYTFGYYRYDGTGQINNFSATINSGNRFGHAGSLGATVNGDNYQSGQYSFYYDSPGTYTATVSGNASLRDGRNIQNYLGDYYYYAPHRHYHFRTLNRGASSAPDIVYTEAIEASVDITVENLNPSIRQIKWDVMAFVGESVDFSVLGYDPRGVGATETMTFAYDFNGNGQYTDYSTSGTSLGSSGSTTFNSIGTHRVGVKLTDGQGGTAYGSFNVSVVAPPPSIAPEPTSLAIFCIGVSCVGMIRRRRQ